MYAFHLSVIVSPPTDNNDSEDYEQQRPVYAQPQSTVPRTESHAQGQQPIGFGRPTDQPQAYGWNQSIYDQPGYNPFPPPAAGYPQPQQGGPIPDPRSLGRSSSYGAPQPQPQSQPQSQHQVQVQSQPVQQAPQPQPQTAYVQPYPAPDNQRASYYHQQPPQQTEPLSQPGPTQTQSAGQLQGQQQPQVQLQSQLHAQSQPQLHHVQSQVSIQAQPQTQSVVPQQQPQPQPQTQTQPQTQPPETQVHPHAQEQAQQTMTGPPFVYDPNATYPDQNVQAWAQYYAQGGTDPTGSVYFISVPDITDAHSSPTAVHAQPHGQVEEQQQQKQQQRQPSSPEARTAHTQRQNSLPNPYGSNVTELGESVSPASAGAAPGPGGNAPWQTLPGQFTQMRVGEPSVGA